MATMTTRDPVLVTGVLLALATCTGCGHGAQTGGSTNWLACTDISECSSNPDAVACSTDGYCVDAVGKRLSALPAAPPPAAPPDSGASTGGSTRGGPSRDGGVTAETDGMAPSANGIGVREEIRLVEPSGLALLERATAGDYACALTRPVTALSINVPLDGAYQFQPVVLDGQAYVSWVERTDPLRPGYGPLETASVGLDGVLQSPRVVFEAPSVAQWYGSNRQKVVAGNARLTFWWDYSDEPVALPSFPAPAPSAPVDSLDSSSGLIQLDAQGAPIAPSRRIDTSDFPLDARVIATRTGFLAAWFDTTATSCTLKLATLDKGAARIGEHMVLTALPTPATPSPWCDVTGIAETSNGIALVYRRPEGEFHVDSYQAFTAAGQALAPPTLLTPTSAFASATASLIAIGNDVLVAWTVAVGPSLEVGKVDATIRIARFGPDGRQYGEVSTLAALVPGQFDSGATWVELGGELGISWTREQKQDMACAEACSYRGTVGYVVLDRTDLTPRSAPIELAPDPKNAAGIAGAAIARTGEDLLFLLSSWTQSKSDVGWSRGASLPASAALRCVQPAMM